MEKNMSAFTEEFIKNYDEDSDKGVDVDVRCRRRLLK